MTSLLFRLILLADSPDLSMAMTDNTFSSKLFEFFAYYKLCYTAPRPVVQLCGTVYCVGAYSCILSCSVTDPTTNSVRKVCIKVQNPSYPESSLLGECVIATKARDMSFFINPIGLFAFTLRFSGISHIDMTWFVYNCLLYVCYADMGEGLRWLSLSAGRLFSGVGVVMPFVAKSETLGRFICNGIILLYVIHIRPLYVLTSGL